MLWCQVVSLWYVVSNGIEKRGGVHYSGVNVVCGVKRCQVVSEKTQYITQPVEYHPINYLLQRFHSLFRDRKCVSLVGPVISLVHFLLDTTQSAGFFQDMPHSKFPL